MSENSYMEKIWKVALVTLTALFLFFIPQSAFTAHANSDPATDGNRSHSNDTTILTSPVNNTGFYWPAIKQSIEGYTDDVYIPEDTARTLWNGTVGNGTSIPTVSGTVNGVTYTAGKSVIPNSVFNPLYYYLNYKDVRDALGANPQALVDNWVAFGKVTKPARVVNKLIVRDGSQSSTNLTEYGSSSYEYVVPSYQKTKTQKDGMVVIPGEVHSNGGMNRKQEIQARSVAKQLADHIFDHVRSFGDGSQIQMLAYATGIVRAYCDRGTFTTTGTYYRTAYGVFIEGEYSSAGSTRALGLIIDYLDVLCQDWNKANPDAKNNYGPFKWVHVNANKWDDQWCQVVCDYHEAYGDPIGAWAGYGKHPNEGGKKQDFQTYVKFAFESDIINTRPPLVDGESPVSTSAPDKNKNIQKNNNTK